ncbi:MAG: hypothetical protein EOO82_02355 [Oxalobacteraceae bacterium]|nr:MAG: hypothetical protein EOO82_02355 [Oxalobacteraceae bacterium]
MTNLALPYFQPLMLRGEVYDLAHLNPFQLRVPSKQVGRELSVNVRFTTHCFTQGYDPNLHPADEMEIVDEGKRRRAFCAVRYGLSSNLPTAVQSLNHPQAKVRQTGSGRNWLHSITVEDETAFYHVFFEVHRCDRQHTRWHRHDQGTLSTNAREQSTTC